VFWEILKTSTFVADTLLTLPVIPLIQKQTVGEVNFLNLAAIFEGTGPATVNYS
jgi:hypothetical protein